MKELKYSYHAYQPLSNSRHGRFVEVAGPKKNNLSTKQSRSRINSVHQQIQPASVGDVYNSPAPGGTDGTTASCGFGSISSTMARRPSLPTVESKSGIASQNSLQQHSEQHSQQRFSNPNVLSSQLFAATHQAIVNGRTGGNATMSAASDVRNKAVNRSQSSPSQAQLQQQYTFTICGGDTDRRPKNGTKLERVSSTPTASTTIGVSVVKSLASVVTNPTLRATPAASANAIKKPCQRKPKRRCNNTITHPKLLSKGTSNIYVESEPDFLNPDTLAPMNALSVKSSSEKTGVDSPPLSFSNQNIEQSKTTPEKTFVSSCALLTMGELFLSERGSDLLISRLDDSLPVAAADAQSASEQMDFYSTASYWDTDCSSSVTSNDTSTDEPTRAHFDSLFEGNQDSDLFFETLSDPLLSSWDKDDFYNESLHW
eukprot:CFRG0826T1